MRLHQRTVPLRLMDSHLWGKRIELFRSWLCISWWCCNCRRQTGHTNADSSYPRLMCVSFPSPIVISDLWLSGSTALWTAASDGPAPSFIDSISVPAERLLLCLRPWEYCVWWDGWLYNTCNPTVTTICPICKKNRTCRQDLMNL